MNEYGDFIDWTKILCMAILFFGFIIMLAILK
jgi:hypothetical protein